MANSKFIKLSVQILIIWAWLVNKWIFIEGRQQVEGHRETRQPSFSYSAPKCLMMWPFSFVNCHDHVGKEGNCGNHPFSFFTPCPLFLNSFAQNHERTQVPPRRILLPSQHKFLLPAIMETWSRPTCRCLCLLRGPNVAPYGGSWKT